MLNEILCWSISTASIRPVTVAWVNSSANQPLTWSGEINRGCDMGAFTLGRLPENWLLVQLHARARIWYGRRASTNGGDRFAERCSQPALTRRQKGKGQHAQT